MRPRADTHAHDQRIAEESNRNTPPVFKELSPKLQALRDAERIVADAGQST